VGAGSAEGSLDAANIFETCTVARRNSVHRATIPVNIANRWKRIVRSSARSRPLKWARRPRTKRFSVLEGVRERYEKFHAVSYTDEAIAMAVYLSSRYIPDRFLPDKAIESDRRSGRARKIAPSLLPDEVAEVQSA